MGQVLFIAGFPNAYTIKVPFFLLILLSPSHPFLPLLLLKNTSVCLDTKLYVVIFLSISRFFFIFIVFIYVNYIYLTGYYFFPQSMYDLIRILSTPLTYLNSWMLYICKSTFSGVLSPWFEPHLLQLANRDPEQPIVCQSPLIF